MTMAVRDDRASKGLKSAKTTLQANPGPCASGGVCSDTEDVGEVEAEWETSGVSGGEEGYVGMDRLGTTGASLGNGTWGEKEGIFYYTATPVDGN
jgi:hypothetical protein